MIHTRLISRDNAAKGLLKLVLEDFTLYHFRGSSKGKGLSRNPIVEAGALQFTQHTIGQ